MPSKFPKTRLLPLDRMGYGKPWHKLSDEERARQSATWVYADTSEDWLKTDLPGRSIGGPIEAGPHEPVPGKPHGDSDRARRRQ
jgi:hypothetical protein